MYLKEMMTGPTVAKIIPVERRYQMYKPQSGIGRKGLLAPKQAIMSLTLPWTSSPLAYGLSFPLLTKFGMNQSGL